MSTALPIDLDLEDLEAARDELAESIVELVELGNSYPSGRSELAETIFKIGGAYTTIVGALDACRDEPQAGEVMP